jgi:hypothetical protein
VVNHYIKENDKGVISFNILRIEHNKQKICSCINPSYEIDEVNRLVVCTGCGAVVDPLDALLAVAQRMDQYSDYQNKAIAQIKTFNELADKALKKKCKNSAFKEMEKHYLVDNCHPHCPKCGEQIDPAEINRWSRKI